MPPLLTVGHGTADQERLGALLTDAGTAALVDIRTAPGSRAHPHVARAELARWLPEIGIAYRWEPRLGGFRRPVPGNPDSVWRSAPFRGYAGHLREPEAVAAMAELAAEAAARPTAVMCSESLWWRCHRRLVADAAVLVQHLDVLHLLHDGRLVPHQPTPGVRLREDGLLVYDGAQERLL